MMRLIFKYVTGRFDQMISVAFVIEIVLAMAGQSAEASKLQYGPTDVLRSAGVEISTPALIAALDHPDSSVRGAAASVLGDAGERAAIPAIFTLLEDDDAFVRIAAADALLDLEDSRGLPVLQSETGNSNVDFSLRAAEVLCERGESGGLGRLAGHLESPQWNVRKMAVLALTQCADTEQARSLVLLAADDDNHRVRLPALEALARTPDVQTVDLLINSLSDSNEVVRYGANKWLEDITCQSFKFRHTAPESARNEAIQNWVSWWKINAEDFAPVQC